MKKPVQPLKPRFPAGCGLFLCVLFTTPAASAQNTLPPASPRNVIIFVADGLRHVAVDPENMPTMTELRRSGVDFVNSHSLMPTFTTPNASAIATGHYIGDTGNFGNTMFLGFPGMITDSFGATHGVESDTVIPDVNEHFSGNYLGEDSLLAAARKAGFNTAAIGKIGPTLIQDITRHNAGVDRDNIHTVIIDDVTGRVDSRGNPAGVPLEKAIADNILASDYFKNTYFRNQNFTGDPPTISRGANGSSGTKVANVPQQKYLIDVVTRIILPTFADPAGNKKPFVMVYWSRDPDATQHNQNDNPEKLTPGINGDTVHSAFRNVDSNLKQLVEYLKSTPDPNVAGGGKMLWDTTNLFITADHGFSTVSRGAIDPAGTLCESYASQQRYRGVTAGQLPPGFLSIDLAHDLGLPLFDADVIDRAAASASTTSPASAPLIVYRQLNTQNAPGRLAEHPSGACGLLGSGIYDRDGYAASAVVLGNGGSDLIYLPAHRNRTGAAAMERDTALMRKIVASLAAKPYISGIFIDTDRFGPIPGALALADINLRGAARTPVPAAVVGFRNFATDPANPELTGVEIADTTLRQGQGMHGSFGRQDTYNNMLAIGPDFKKQLADTDPISNADIVITLSKTLGIDLLTTARGQLHGRVISEALADGPAPRGSQRLQKESTPSEDGIKTLLLYQRYTDESGRPYLYFDTAGFPGMSIGLPKRTP